jgi:hypothetical protein
MMLLPSVLFIAHSFLLPIWSQGKSPLHSSCSLRHGRSVSKPSPTPRVGITIVNATSVPAISLSASAPAHSAPSRNTNQIVSYPLFRQGTWTSDEPFQTNEFRYIVRTTNNLPITEKTIRFKPLSSQTLLLTGDLSQSGPAERLPQLGNIPPVDVQHSAPNFQFHIYPEEVGCTDPCHYRIVNAMPSKLLLLKSLPDGKKPSQLLAILTPGNSILMVKQPPCVEWTAEIDGQSYPVTILQEGAAANCLIPFFLKDGKPAFVRIFEDP